MDTRWHHAWSLNSDSYYTLTKNNRVTARESYNVAHTKIHMKYYVQYNDTKRDMDHGLETEKPIGFILNKREHLLNNLLNCS